MIKTIKYQNDFNLSDFYVAKATKINKMASGKTREMALINLKRVIKENIKNEG